MLEFAIREKSQSVIKKGQAETCPYPQKEAKMKTCLYNTTKLYLVKQKSSRIYVSLHKTMAVWIIAKEEHSDRHILRNLKKLGVIDDFPESLSRRQYLTMEVKMKEFSAAIHIPMSHLDFVLWYKETGEILK
jgi:hypothetical protein